MNWESLSGLLERNRQKQFQVNVLEVRKAKEDVELFPIRASSSPASIPTPLTPVPSLSPEIQKAMIVLEEPKAIVPEEPKSAKYSVDPIVVGIEHTDPLYIGAPERTRRAIECECAQAIEARLDELYKSEAGRSRGWTKVGLDAMIKPRCASGGDLRELDRAKKGFAWSAILEDKVTSAFLDFVCVAKGIRVAIWFTEKKQVVVYPAADATAAAAPRDESEAAVATKAFNQIYHVDSNGHPRSGLLSPTALLEFCAKESWTLLPPHSVLHSLNGLTLSELESVATQLGLVAEELPRSKADRVAVIASHKLKLRLQM